MTIRDDMDPALRARRSAASRPGPREFFTEVDYRDPEVMRTHGYHWFDLARMANSPHASPIRRGPLLYNIFDTRTEGHATGWEELMLQAGMFDARPRSRELIYVLRRRAGRARARRSPHARERVHARAGGGVRVREHAARLAAARREHRPRRAASVPAAAGVRHELRDRQDPGRDAHRRAQRQLGDTFSMQDRSWTTSTRPGLIPVSLLRWELTGRLPDDVAKLLKDRTPLN